MCCKKFLADSNHHSLGGAGGTGLPHVCKEPIEAEACDQAHEVRSPSPCLPARLAQWQTRGCLLGLSVGGYFINILSCVVMVPRKISTHREDGVTTSQCSGHGSRSPHHEVCVHPSGQRESPGWGEGKQAGSLTRGQRKHYRIRPWVHKSIRVTIRHLPFTIDPALPWAHKVLAAQHLTVSSQSLQAWEGAGLSRLWLWLPEVSVLSKELGIKEPRCLVASLKPSAFDILLLSPERRERWTSPAHMPHGPRALQSTLSETYLGTYCVPGTVPCCQKTRNRETTKTDF